MSYTFGIRSEQQLTTLDPRLVRVLRRALELSPLDFGVLQGYRNQAEQDAAFDAGTSKLRWPHGKHNSLPSAAADVAPWIEGSIPWSRPGYWYTLAGVILTVAELEDVALRWGGDWDGDSIITDQTFNDLGHFELRKGIT